MNSIYSVTPGTTRRRRTAVVIVAGILSVAGTGMLMSWSASADTRPASLDANAVPVVRIDIDSLYAAQAATGTQVDSTTIAAIEPDRTLSGNASWYGPGFNGHRTANGERFDTQSLTAAHKTLPFGTLVRVTDSQTGKSVLVRINDRGPFCRGRILDLSEAAARPIGIRSRGTGSIRAEVYSTPERGGLLAFDADGRAMNLKGYSVKVQSYNSFEEARARQNTLHDKGYQSTYLIQDRTGGSLRYHVTIGLYGSQRLCENLLAETISEFGSAGMVQLDGQKMSWLELAGS